MILLDDWRGPGGAPAWPSRERGEKLADASMAVRHVFIRDLLLDAHIGVHRHEKGRRQRVRINIDLTVLETARIPAMIWPMWCVTKILSKR